MRGSIYIYTCTIFFDIIVGMYNLVHIFFSFLFSYLLNFFFLSSVFSLFFFLTDGFRFDVMLN